MVCPSCAQPLPKAEARPSRDDRAGGITNTDGVVRAERDIVGRDKLEGDFRQAGGANVGGSININANNHVFAVVLAAFFFAVVLGILALVIVSRAPVTRAPEPQDVNLPVAQPAPAPAPVALPVSQPVSQPAPVAPPVSTAETQPAPAPVAPGAKPPAVAPLTESHLEVMPGTKDLKVTAYGLYTPSESESRQAAEEKASQKAQGEAVRLVTERLMTMLMPEEQDGLRDFVATWGSGKLLIESSRVESQDGAVLATLEAKVSTREFEDCVKRVSTSRLSPADSTTPFEMEFGFHRQNGQRIADGGTIRSSEQFWLEFKASRDCYVYVLNEGSSGNVTPLFPRPDIDKGSYVKEGKSVRLPADDYDYRADRTVGSEKITLVASLAPLNDIEFFAQKFTLGKADPTDRVLLAQEIKTRDIGIAPRVETDAKSLEIEKLQGKGALVRTVVFEHED
jgi:hypothetical protein